MSGKVKTRIRSPSSSSHTSHTSHSTSSSSTEATADHSGSNSTSTTPTLPPLPSSVSSSHSPSLSSVVVKFVASVFPTMFLVCKFTEYKRQQQDQSKRKVTERELSNLNHKIDKLLVKLEEHEPEIAGTPDEECVICISAKATMQTFPCGHRVVCRKCFVKTIQVAVSQRLLPLRCVICRAKILRLKQTTHGGIVTGAVLRSKVAAAGHHHHQQHHHHSSSIGSGSSVSSGIGNGGHSPASTANASNPFYISPATSPVSPITEVFREQRAVWVKNYDAFGYSPNGQSPTSAQGSSPSVSLSPSSSSLDVSVTCANFPNFCMCMLIIMCPYS